MSTYGGVDRNVDNLEWAKQNHRWLTQW
jgi:hypothetical protein